MPSSFFTSLSREGRKKEQKLSQDLYYKQMLYKKLLIHTPPQMLNKKPAKC